MSENTEAQEVLTRAIQEMTREIARCGQSGGVGRVQNYAPVFNNLVQALKNLKDVPGPNEFEDNTPKEMTFAQKMQAAKAAKKQSA